MSTFLKKCSCFVLTEFSFTVLWILKSLVNWKILVKSELFSVDPCAGHQNCNDCLQDDRCGWCALDSATGLGSCLMGSLNASMSNGFTCPSYQWNFLSCPGKIKLFKDADSHVSAVVLSRVYTYPLEVRSTKIFRDACPENFKMHCPCFWVQ